MADFPVVSLEDKNSACYSMLATVSLGRYLELILPAYEDQGGISGQRAPITTKTGLKIRSRLVSDLKKGAVIPPVVVGVVVSNQTKINKLRKSQNSEELINYLVELKSDVSIIDGMQRTTALIDAGVSEKNTFVRIELWIAKRVDSLIYRMLVLNTGQVPWDLKRQLDTLYRPIVSAVKKEVHGARIIGLDETFRRSQAGEYRSTRIVELFLAFSSRSIDIDIKEKVAEEFAKIDITEATAQDEFMPLFISTMKIMVALDNAIDKQSKKTTQTDDLKIKSGRDIFTSSPGSIGFVVAIAEQILGTPGFDYDITNAQKEIKKVEKNINAVIKHLSTLSDSELIDFLDLDTLNQVLNVKSSRIGEYQRNVYKRAFSVLINKSNQIIKQRSMTPCWQAR